MAKSILCAHVIPVHWSDEDAKRLIDLNGRAIKVDGSWNNVPPHIDSIIAAQPDLIVIRNHGISEQKDGDPVTLGVQHAQHARGVIDTLTAQFPQVDKSRYVTEGINEPELWGKNPPAWVVAYEIARITEMRKYGLRSVVFNGNTGWPADYGIADSSVNWDVFRPLLDMIPYGSGDFMGLHEYWWRGGPEKMRPDAQGKLQGGWLWDAGRYLHLPNDVHIMLTEVGMDNAVQTGTHEGWMHLDGTMDERAQRYVADLLWYQRQLAKDKRIYAAFIFTYDYASSDWETFSTRDGVFLQYFTPALASYADSPVWGGPSVNRWRFLCNKWGDAYSIDPRIIAAVIKLESGGNMGAAGSSGEVGMMQIMPASTIAGRPAREILLNPDKNVQWGASILKSALNAFGGSLAHGLVGYNRGIGATQTDLPLKHANSQRYLKFFAAAWRELWGDPLPGDVAGYLGGVVVPPVPTPLPVSSIRDAAFNWLHVPHNPDSAFYKEAVKRQLGRPVTAEVDVGEYRLQGWEKGILACEIGQWDKMTLVPWLPS